MRRLKKAAALCLSLLALLTMPVKASAVELREEIIDTGRTGTLTIYKYDITSSEKDGVWDSSYVSTGVFDQTVNDTLGASGKENIQGNGQTSYGYAISGVEFSYLKVADIVQYTDSTEGAHKVEVLYGIPKDIGAPFLEALDWLGDILSGMGDALSVVFEGLGADIAVDIWNALVEWIYTTIFDAVADLFTSMNNMGAEIFTLGWVNAVVRLFTLFGWALFAVGVAGAVFEVAIEAQTGKTSIQGAAINILKGFFACALVGVVPVELYKFCVSLQNSFAGDLTRIFAGAQGSTIGEIGGFVLSSVFSTPGSSEPFLKMLFFLLAFSYCAIKVFFANIKRGGILLIQIAVGSLYMFSVPRGYTDGFNQWCKQIAAICLTAFLQTTLLFLGMLTIQENLLLGIGIMLTANEVPRIAQQFGLDSSVRVNVSSVMYSTTSAMNLTKSLMRKP